MILHTRRFGSITATIEPNDDREGVNCYVAKCGETSSLECADGEGYIGDNINNTFPANVGDKVRDWAESKGY